jgi:hypothetical protein
MKHENEETTSLHVSRRGQHDGLMTAVSFVARGEDSMTSLAADWIYQLAAVTAGLFLLATLL